MRLLSLLMLSCICALPWQAMAANAYVVDDADIVAPHTFQSENWVSRADTGETVLVTNGAYQLLPRTEFMLQFTHHGQSDDHDDTVSPQVKYLWRTGDGDTVKSSIVIGADYLIDESRVTNYYAYVPVSLQATKALDLNLNIGWLQAPQTDHNTFTWGVGAEYHMNEEFAFVGELFGHDRVHPAFQLGPRYELSKALQFDLIYGHNVLGASEDMVTAGVTVSF